jgi:hypothetical protein
MAGPTRPLRMHAEYRARKVAADREKIIWWETCDVWHPALLTVMPAEAGIQSGEASDGSPGPPLSRGRRKTATGVIRLVSTTKPRMRGPGGSIVTLSRGGVIRHSAPDSLIYPRLSALNLGDMPPRDICIEPGPLKRLSFFDAGF